MVEPTIEECKSFINTHPICMRCETSLAVHVVGTGIQIGSLCQPCYTVFSTMMMGILK